MKTKAQREFIRQRREYEKQLKEKAKNEELSLPEKLEWQQMRRNSYREKLFKFSKLELSPYIIIRLIPCILVVIAIVVGIIRSLFVGLFGLPTDNSEYEDYSYDVIQEGTQVAHVVDPRYNDIYHAILETSDMGNYLYDIYADAQSSFESTQVFDIDALYLIDAFEYEHFTQLKDSLFTSIDDLHESILALAKLEYGGTALSDEDLETMKTTIESAKKAFDEQITFAHADLMKLTYDEKAN